MTTTERAARIRETLKSRHDWDSRSVSVRVNYFSMGSSIRVTINDPGIPLSVVRDIAKGAENIYRGEVSENILDPRYGGSNAFVTVAYSHEAIQILGRRYADAVQRAVNALEPSASALAQVEGTEFLVGIPQPGRIAIWNDRYLTDTYSVDSAAEFIGAAMVERA